MFLCLKNIVSLQRIIESDYANKHSFGQVGS